MSFKKKVLPKPGMPKANSLGTDPTGKGEVKEAGDAAGAPTASTGFYLLKDCVARAATTREYADVQFVVGESKTAVPAHSLILAITSPVFEAMLLRSNSSGLEQDDKDLRQIALPGVSERTLSSALSILYNDEPVSVPMEEMAGLLAFGKRYQCDKVLAAVAAAMENDLDIDNAILRYEEAPSLLGVKEFGMAFISRYAKDVFETSAFLQASRATLERLLSSESLAVDEVLIWKGLVGWAKAHAKVKPEQSEAKHVEEVVELLKPLIRHVRFPLLSNKSFSSLVLPYKDVFSQEQLLNLFSYYAIPEDTEEAEEQRAKFPTLFSKEKRGGASAALELDSKIITTPELLQEFMLLFTDKHEGPSRLESAKLLFNSKKHGATSQAFHSKVDNKGEWARAAQHDQGLVLFGGRACALACVVSASFVFACVTVRVRVSHPSVMNVLCRAVPCHAVSRRAAVPGPTIVLYKVGKWVFGGYFGSHWTSSSSYGTGKAWLFSLSNPSKKPIKLLPSNTNLTYMDASYGRTFIANSSHYFLLCTRPVVLSSLDCAC